MKIAILVNHVGSGAGTERAVANLANLLVKYGGAARYEVHVVGIFTKEGPSYYPLEPSIGLIHLGKTDHKSRPGLLVHYMDFIPTLRRLSRKLGIDCLIGTSHAMNALLPLIAAGQKIRTIGCEHLSFGVISPVSRMLRRLFYGFLDMTVVLTPRDADKYTGLRRLRIIPNAVPFSPAELSPLNARQILAIGRYTRQKGFDTLLDSAVLFLEQLPGWRLKIIGDGEMRAVLTEKIKNSGLEDRIELAHPTPHIEAEYVASSIYVMSSRYEGLPMVLIEAQAMGLPIVSFNCPEGPSEVINDGTDGFLVEEGDIRTLADRLVTLAQDDTKRKAFGQAAKEHSARFSPEKVFLEWNSLLTYLEQQ